MHSGETRLGQGREAAKEFLRQNPELTAQIDSLIRSRVGLGDLPASEIDDGLPRDE